MPFVDKERYQILPTCSRLRPYNDLFRDQEQHKFHSDVNEWQCRYCKKKFYEEKYPDKHFETDITIIQSNSRLLADICGASHCDLVLDSTVCNIKCNPALLQGINICSLANSCFPVNKGPSASSPHEVLLGQFCDAHTCTGKQKTFSKGRRGNKKGNSSISRCEQKKKPY